MIILIFMMNLCFSNRRGLHPSCSRSSDSSNPAPGRRFQVSASQSKPVRPTSPGLQHQSRCGRPPCSLWLRQELQRVLRHLSPLRRQHTEWPLQGSSTWVHSIQICRHKILTVHFFQHVSVFLKMYWYFFVNPNGAFTPTLSLQNECTITIPTLSLLPYSFHEYGVHKTPPPTFIMLQFAFTSWAPPRFYNLRFKQVNNNNNNNCRAADLQSIFSAARKELI